MATKKIYYDETHNSGNLELEVESNKDGSVNFRIYDALEESVANHIVITLPKDTVFQLAEDLQDI